MKRGLTSLETTETRLNDEVANILVVTRSIYLELHLCCNLVLLLKSKDVIHH
jgi:hypothetical protein